MGGVPPLRARLIASGFALPLGLQAAPGDSERLYVVEQGGRIRVILDGQVLPEPFLDISDRLGTGGERGLLGLAFHPEFATNGRIFVNYTNPGGATRISEFRATSADRADPATERVRLLVPQPFSNHNGGSVAFGSDGLLYIALGDGGSGGDPLGSGQDLSVLLGKILRIDVDSGAPYAVPAPRRDPQALARIIQRMLQGQAPIKAALGAADGKGRRTGPRSVEARHPHGHLPGVRRVDQGGPR